MKIWVDADACPKVIKEILFRAAERTQTDIILVANQWMQVPSSPFITIMQVEQGADIADDKIAELCVKDDLIITADIPLAARVVDKGALALDPRGRLYDRDNIKQVLGMRDFMDSLRGSGIETGGPSGFGQRERQEFSNLLDKIVTRAKKPF